MVSLSFPFGPLKSACITDCQKKQQNLFSVFFLMHIQFLLIGGNPWICTCLHAFTPRKNPPCMTRQWSRSEVRRECIISYWVCTILGVNRTGQATVLCINTQAANTKFKMCSFWLKSNTVRALLFHDTSYYLRDLQALIKGLISEIDQCGSGERQKGDGWCSAVMWCIMRAKSSVWSFPLYYTSLELHPLLQHKWKCFVLTKNNNVKIL